jgi:hypothetical protein
MQWAQEKMKTNSEPDLSFEKSITKSWNAHQNLHTYINKETFCSMSYGAGGGGGASITGVYNNWFWVRFARQK